MSEGDEAEGEPRAKGEPRDEPAPGLARPEPHVEPEPHPGPAPGLAGPEPLAELGPHAGPEPKPGLARPEPHAELAPGLALERTNLAWSRSGLALVGCLAVMARRFVPLDTRADRVAAFVILAAAGLGWATALLLSRRRAGALDPHAGPQDRHLRLIAVSTAAVGAGAFLIGLFPPH